MIRVYAVEVTTDASGDFTVDSVEAFTGKVVGILFDKGTLDATADLTITAKRHGFAIYTQANIAADARITPVQQDQLYTDGSVVVGSYSPVFLSGEYITVTVAQGGNVKTGSVHVLVES